MGREKRAKTSWALKPWTTRRLAAAAVQARKAADVHRFLVSLRSRVRSVIAPATTEAVLSERLDPQCHGVAVQG